MNNLGMDHSKNGITHELGIVVGNVHDKTKETNPLFRFLINNYMKNLDDLVHIISPQSIHEVGCGEGHVISRYSKRGISLSGSDFSQMIIEKAKSLYSDAEIEFTARSIYEVTELESAELVLCCEVLEHLENPDYALEKIRFIANPFAIFAVPHEPFWRFSNILRGAYLQELGNTPGHFQHWNRKQFKALLSHNFEILSMRYPYPWLMALAKKR